jgi:hypothetical protein
MDAGHLQGDDWDRRHRRREDEAVHRLLDDLGRQDLQDEAGRRGDSCRHRRALEKKVLMPSKKVVL